jgi:hypothetical protein
MERFANQVTMAFFALYARLLNAWGVWTTDGFLNEVSNLSVPLSRFARWAEFFLAENIQMESNHIHLMKDNSLGDSMSYHAKLSMACGSNLRFYTSGSYAHASATDTERLCRRVWNCLALGTNKHKDFYSLYLDGSNFDSIWMAVRMFRSKPEMFRASLHHASTLGYTKMSWVRKQEKRGRLRLKLAPEAHSRFIRFLFEHIRYTDGALGQTWPEISDACGHALGNAAAKRPRDDGAYRRLDAALRGKFSQVGATVMPGNATFARSYAKGLALADVAVHTCEALAYEARLNDVPVVVYGRDCEVFYHLLREFYPDVRTTYVLAPRPLTTENYDAATPEQRESFKTYLRRNIPARAIHFDSGFSGTIINWVRDKMDIPPFSIRLMSTEVNGYELFGAASHSSKMRNNIVLDGIEHEEHRLQEATKSCWGRWEFAPTVGSFWSRLCGMRDGMLLIRAGNRALIPIDTLCGISIPSAPITVVID